MKVSIIIPVYNVASYIEDCIRSVIKQTYRDLEVILVDDCSPDNSMDIAKHYIESVEHNGIHFCYFTHDHNRTQAGARNTGVKNSTGEYVFFLDSDDEITPDCIETLVKLANKYPNVDIVQGNYDIINSDQFDWMKMENRGFNEYVSDKQWIKEKVLDLRHDVFHAVPQVVANKLIRRSFIVQNDYWFREGIMYEDTLWNMMCWKSISSIAYSTNKTYIYKVRENSTMSGRDMHIEKSLRSHMTIYHDFIPTTTFFSDQEMYYILHSLLLFRQSLKGHTRYIKEYDALLKDFCKNFDFRRKIKMCLLYMRLPLFLVKGQVLKKILL